jgi:hypothetical protein
MTMHDDPVRRAARTAAQRLESRRWPGLTMEIEAALDDRRSKDLSGRGGHPDQYVDATSLASLIVAAADLAWSVYAELRTKTSKPAPAIIQRLRVELTESREIESTERDRVIEVIVDEIIRPDDQADH